MSRAHRLTLSVVGSGEILCWIWVGNALAHQLPNVVTTVFLFAVVLRSWRGELSSVRTS